MKKSKKKIEIKWKRLLLPFYPVPFSDHPQVYSVEWQPASPTHSSDVESSAALCPPYQPYYKHRIKEDEFKAEIYVLKKEEGGRHTPFHNKYRPQFYFRTTDVTGEISLIDGREMVMPGDNVTIKVKLIVPIAMDKGLRFAIREGGRTVGAGQVTEILD